jgi:hypothetical protein
MIRVKEDREPSKHVEHERQRADREAPKLESVGAKVESKASGFDRTAYQREYMRKWRAGRQEKDR